MMADDIFNLNTYYNNLRTCSLGRPCICFEEVNSTIDVVSDESINAIVLARKQTHGRGQGGHVWQSPAGCAMASVRIICSKISPLAPKISFIQHFIALAAVKTLEQINPQKLGKHVIKLKWPNDIIYMPSGEDKKNTNTTASKIGGILVRSTDFDSCYDIIMSFALNVFNSKPTTCVQDILGSNQRISMEYIVAEIMNKLEAYTVGYTEESFQSLKLDYTQRCIQIDKLIEDEIHGQVKVKGVNEDGFLYGKRCSDLQDCIVTKMIQLDGINLERV